MVCGQLHALAALSPVHIGQETVKVSEPVWTRRKIPCPYRESNPGRQSNGIDIKELKRYVVIQIVAVMFFRITLFPHPLLEFSNNRYGCQLYVKTLLTMTYEGVSKSFGTGRLERELQMVQLSATRCSCIAIL
jgi:hypothetical protein